MSPYRVVYGKPCHLLVEIKHRVWWAVKMLNYNLNEASEVRKLQLSELDGIRADVYESARSYKERAKLFHDRYILKKESTPGVKVLFYHSRLYRFPEKLRSRWIGLYILLHVFPYGAVEIQDPDTSVKFKVNGQRLKNFGVAKS